MAVSRNVRYGNISLSDIMATGSTTSVSTPDQAMKMAEFYNSINKISNTVATLSRNFYRDSSRLTEQDDDQVFYWKKMMSPGLVPSKVIKAWVLTHLKGGNGYMIMTRDKLTGSPDSYTNRKWDEMIPFRDNKGVAWYYCFIEKKVYTWYDVLHLADVTDDSLMGKSKVSHQAESLGKSKATSTFVNQAFTNSLFLGAVIEYPVESGINNEIAADLEKAMAAAYGGVDKKNTIAVITDGGKLHQLKSDIPLGDSKYIESENMTKKDIRGMFGIPDEIKDESTMTQYYQDAIMPIVKMIEEEVNAKVIPVNEQGNMYYKFEVDSILRADVNTRSIVLERYLRNSMMTINEARTLLNLPSIPGGDEPMVMANNMVPLAQLEEFVNAKM